MPEKYFCDGQCGEDVSLGNKTEIMIRRSGESSWTRHRLCSACAERNVFLHRNAGKWVSDRGFASDVLR